tara:strand:+ start:92 stop:445 length:354 start_codon:yes stop_codon:yes gene_type:complete
MKTEAQNTLTRILFIALLPLAFFACGENGAYFDEDTGQMSYEVDEALGAGGFGREKDEGGGVQTVQCKWGKNDSGHYACGAKCDDGYNPSPSNTQQCGSDAATCSQGYIFCEKTVLR